MGMPDVCITPVPPPVSQAPIPYPNTGMLNQAQKTSKKVKFVGKEVVTLKSEISRSMGDEAGTQKGVMSGSNMDKVTFKKGSSKVKGKPSRGSESKKRRCRQPRRSRIVIEQST